nr:peptidoglycan DD-metalloendopeptidase family protein [Thiospirillum jenense]
MASDVPPGFYRVQPGDSLSLIGQRHGIRYQTLARWNQLKPPYRINVGSLLRIAAPDGQVTQSSSGGKSPSQTAPAQGRSQAPPPAPGSAAAGSGIKWQWPVRGKLQQKFVSGDRTHQGVRIKAALGSPVLSTAAGTVVYSGSGLKGYGNLIIVKHNDHFLSAYGFNRRLIAREGQSVRAGQVLAEVGQATDGDALLHFEIRRDGSAVDPLLYLPRLR